MARRGDQIDPESMQALSSPRCATVEGFSLHANVSVHAGDRDRLERLARYCARPPVAVEHLEQLADGRLLYRFKRAWRDGTTHVVLDPPKMIERLAALIPAPHAHVVRYAGILAPAAKWRPLIVPAAAAAAAAAAAECVVDCSVPETTIHANECLADRTEHETSVMQSPTVPHGRNYTWAELMKRVWELDVLECPRCHGRSEYSRRFTHLMRSERSSIASVGLPVRHQFQPPYRNSRFRSNHSERWEKYRGKRVLPHCRFIRL